MARKSSWNKNFTKFNHPSVLKISETFKRRKIDNFFVWRERMKELGLIKSEYLDFKRNGDLAELIGVILGDGSIGKFPRSESLTILSNSKNAGFIARYSSLIERIFGKKPALTRHAKGVNCVRIRIYEKKISERLNIPAGKRKNLSFAVPKWILANKELLKRYLRGLYEAEGSLCVHKPTYTYKFLFSNRNKSLLNNVFTGMIVLGFHPHKSKDQIQISRKEEVYKAKKLLKFREY